MRHGIIGAGVVGSAWATWLATYERDVIVYDIDKKAAERTGCRVVDMQTLEKEADLIWICTAEWHLDRVCEQLAHTTKRVVIRSTIPPGELDRLRRVHDIQHIAHMPEFLREKTAVQDTFNQDRYVIGTTDEQLFLTIRDVLDWDNTPVHWVTPTGSSLVKLIANNWLSTQISFWNEIKTLLDTYPDVQNNLISYIVLKDERISAYGSKLTGKPFGGKCLPKDLNMLLETFFKQSQPSPLLTSVKLVNEHRRGGKETTCYKCPNCNKILTVDEWQNSMGFCPECNREVVVIDGDE